MARRRSQVDEAVPEKGDGPPAWLFRFRFGQWVEGATPDSPDPARSESASARDLVEYNGARRRWNEARRQWCRANDRIMTDVYPETHETYKQLAAQMPGRVVTPDWAAESDNFRDRAQMVMRAYGGRAPDHGAARTASEADFPVYGTPDLEEG